VTLTRVIVVVERTSVWEAEYIAELEAAEKDEPTGIAVAPYVSVKGKDIASCAATRFTDVKSTSEQRSWKCMITVAYWEEGFCARRLQKLMAEFQAVSEVT
jgi:hypothetical protein